MKKGEGELPFWALMLISLGLAVMFILALTVPGATW